jgi:carbon monoxide dehydrogenase subunit G
MSPAKGKIGAMPLNAHPIAPPVALRRHRGAGLALLTLLALVGSAVPALAAGPTSATAAPAKTGAATAKKTAAPAKTSRKAKPAVLRQQAKSEADGLALAAATVESINEAQLNVAMRVLTGPADCEFNEHVTVEPMEGHPGHFHVGFKGQRYTMVPEETATGAVRLVDRRAGMVWLQIPVKSMLMNSKLGQRMVDACTHAEQRAAVKAVAEAGSGLGILPTPVATTVMVATAQAATAAPAAITAAAPAASAVAPASTAALASPAAPAAMAAPAASAAGPVAMTAPGASAAAPAVAAAAVAAALAAPASAVAEVAAAPASASH